MMTFFTTPKLEQIGTICRRYCTILLIALAFVLGPLLPSAVYAQDGVIIHTVVPGEYLSSIARKYNVTVGLLMSYNSIRDPNLIRPGQQIRIPSAAGPSPTSTPVPAEVPQNEAPAAPAAQPPRAVSDDPGTPTARSEPAPSPPRTSSPEVPSGYTASGEPVYTVRRGDTLYGIGTRFGVSVPAIIQRNNLRSNVIIVSQRLIIPLSSGPPPAVYSPQIAASGSTAASQPTPTPEAAPAIDLFLLPTAPPTPTPATGARYR